MDEHACFGRFVLLGRVGVGQLLEVWIAGEESPELGRRTCVLKRVAPAFKELKVLRRVIEGEVRVARAVDHLGIVAFLDAGQIDDIPYLCLELVDGIALRQISMLPVAPGVPAGVVMEIGLSVAGALAYAHGLARPDGVRFGLTHGRLSPANILVSRDGAVKVADLGVAFAQGQQTDELIPTPDQIHYFAPEQVRMDPIEGRTDVFSLGVIMTELLSGRLLLPDGVAREPSLPELVRERCSSAPRGAPPRELVDLLIRMTDLDPAARPGASEVQSRLESSTRRLSDADRLDAYLAREVFAQVPTLADVPEVTPPESVLGAARIPNDSLRAMQGGPSYPTTGIVVLDEIIEEPSSRSTLVGVSVEPGVEAPPMLDLPLIPLDEVDEPPAVALETYRLGPEGVRFLLAYDPYLRAIAADRGAVVGLEDPSRFEYFFVRGGPEGPRLIKKCLEARFYRDQVVILLEGSRLLRELLPFLLVGARQLPPGVMSARGTSAISGTSEKEGEQFLRVHEQRLPRPRLDASSASDLRGKFLRFVRKDG